MFLHGRLIAGRYRLVEIKGSGSQAMVYKAADEQNGNKPVALKVLMAVNQGAAERFAREITLLAEQRSANILHVFGSGSFELDGKTYEYCVMPYIAGGKTLEHVFREYEGNYPPDRPIQGSYVPLPRLLLLMTQAGNGLKDAHERGVVHRDFKPSNVLVYRDKLGNEQAMVMDFGIAKVVREEELASGAKLTITDMALGTPEYMAPQQGFGPTDDKERDAKRQDKRNDIYSFGVSMFEGVTGQNPYPYENDRLAVWEAVQRGMLKPDPISKYCAGIPEQLVKLIDKCMAWHQEDRPANMGEVLHELSRIRLDLATDATSTSEFPVGLPSPSLSDLDLRPRTDPYALTIDMPSTPPSIPAAPLLPRIMRNTAGVVIRHADDADDDQVDERVTKPSQNYDPGHRSAEEPESNWGRWAFGLIAFMLTVLVSMFFLKSIGYLAKPVSDTTPQPSAEVSAPPVQTAVTVNSSTTVAPPAAPTYMAVPVKTYSSPVAVAPDVAPVPTQPLPAPQPTYRPPSQARPPVNNRPPTAGEPEGPIDPGPPM